MIDFNQLNPQQLQAVKHLGSPILVFAGAGSGKTRVLTYKMAYLIEEIGLPPENILAVTFTNKAASEMRNRVNKLISLDLSGLNIGTFHSISASILRKNIHHLGYENNFTIYDQSDALSVVKNIINDMNLDTKRFDPKYFYYMISNSKNKLISHKDVQMLSNTYVDEMLPEIFKEYHVRLKEFNAVDFDDLLILPLELFKVKSDILKYYQNKFKYVLVDEYQDTNKPQFHFIYNIAKNHQDICVVGDDDQSIYGWRGADISNILDFNKSFNNPFIVKLEQNYRSTKNVLDVANSLIKNNVNRSEKSLWTENCSGDKVHYENIFNEKMEAQYILNVIQKKCKSDYSLNDVVVLYRTNYQSRIIEDSLRRKSIPYHIVGGVKFYDRKEIKDVLAYLRFINNNKDDISFLRILNFPVRGIGKTSIGKILKMKLESDGDVLHVLGNLNKGDLGKKQIESIKHFVDLIKELKDLSNGGSAYDVVTKLINSIDLEDHYGNQGTPEAADRWENVQELINSIQEYCDNSNNISLTSFLEEVSLLTDIDRWNSGDECVTLMTVHSAKGLEFPVVIIAGMEEGLFPHSNSIDEPEGVEEERRLFYVAITRAMESLYLYSTDSRMRFGGGYTPSIRSRFIDEIPSELLSTRENRGYSTNLNKETSLYSKNVSKTENFNKNDIVNHKLYGKGRVVDTIGHGENARVTVIFSGNVEKKFVQKYANLSLIK
ncbi:MAG: ATP-dependent DNA helicase PcrA [Candidatus Marinimicrobia bacterium]|nr:ATP-dependent DNA helicase PcrA [Candidatus Neomarinimicrobiota bacterium]